MCFGFGAKPVASVVKKSRMRILRACRLRRRPLDTSFFLFQAGVQLVDVIAEGLPIDRGQRVLVTKARGNRVLVRAVEA